MHIQAYHKISALHCINLVDDLVQPEFKLNEICDVFDMSALILTTAAIRLENETEHMSIHLL